MCRLSRRGRDLIEDRDAVGIKASEADSVGGGREDGFIKLKNCRDAEHMYKGRRFGGPRVPGNVYKSLSTDNGRGRPTSEYVIKHSSHRRV